MKTIKRPAIPDRLAVLTPCMAGLLFLASLAAHDGWVRLPAHRTETAFYVELENHSAQKRAVVSASSDAAAKAEMHKMETEGDMMGMMPVDQIGIPANGKTSLSPNGLHVMLFGRRKKLAVGDKVGVTLKLDDGTTVPVTATVRK